MHANNMTVIIIIMKNLMPGMNFSVCVRLPPLKDISISFSPVFTSIKSRNKTVDLPDEIVSLIHKFYNTLDKSERKKRKYLFDYVGRTAYRHFNHWCRVADIPERPIHALRATCIKFAHEAGWSDEAISKLTGDKIATIQEHYRIPSVDEMRQLMQKKAFV